jgi:hypothetical protein
VDGSSGRATPGQVWRRLRQAGRGELTEPNRQELAEQLRAEGRRSRVWARRELALLSTVFGLIGLVLLVAGLFGSGHPSGPAWSVAVLFTVGGLLGVLSLVLANQKAKRWLTALALAAVISGIAAVVFVR